MTVNKGPLDFIFIIYLFFLILFDPLISKAVRLSYEYFVFLGRVTNPSAKPPFLEDQFVPFSLASLLRPVRLWRHYQEQKFPPA